MGRGSPPEPASGQVLSRRSQDTGYQCPLGGGGGDREVLSSVCPGRPATSRICRAQSRVQDSLSKSDEEFQDGDGTAFGGAPVTAGQAARNPAPPAESAASP